MRPSYGWGIKSKKITEHLAVVINNGGSFYGRVILMCQVRRV